MRKKERRTNSKKKLLINKETIIVAPSKLPKWVEEGIDKKIKAQVEEELRRRLDFYVNEDKNSIRDIQLTFEVQKTLQEKYRSHFYFLISTLSFFSCIVIPLIFAALFSSK